MATITEDYVSFETAKLLKEKGFDEKVISFYPPGNIPRPTLQMAMKWLRETHHIFIRIIQSHIEYCTYEIYYNHGDFYTPRMYYNTYEEAAEAAIKYSLENLI